VTTYDRIEDIICKYVADVPEGLVGALEDFMVGQTSRLEVQLEELQSKIDSATRRYP